MRDKALRKSSIFRFHRGLIEQGVDVGALYARLNINPEDMASEEGTLSMGSYFALLDVASRISGIRFLAAKMALTLDSDDLGVLAYLIRNAGNFEHALDILRRYVALVSPGSEVVLIENAQDCVVSYRVNIAAPSECYQDVEGTLVQFVLMIREGLRDPSWQPQKIFFAHSAGGERGDEGFPVGCCVVFDHPFSGIVIPRAMMQNPITNSDPKLLSILESQVSNSVGDILNQHSFVDSVRLLITSGVGNSGVTSSDVAAALGMSRRTMGRRLQDCGTSYAVLREAIVFEQAKTGLLISSASVAHIAQELGYSDSTAFNRMFKRLSGLTPLAYRKTHGER